MRRAASLMLLLAPLTLAAGLGCSHRTYIAAPPPPPMGPPPLIQVAERNGFDTGRADGARDLYNRLAFAPRRTRAYADTPGYDPRLGPFGPYQNAFRNAYLRGYGEGFRAPQ